MVELTIESESGDLRLIGTMLATTRTDGWDAEIAFVPLIQNPTWGQVMGRAATIRAEDGQTYIGRVVDHIVLVDRYDRVVVRGVGAAPPAAS